MSRGAGTAMFLLSVAPGGEAMKYVGRYADEVLCFIRKNCFLAGTIVRTPDGVILIERLEPGDTVLAFNTANDSLGAKIVLQTFARETNRLLYLEAAGDTIWTTPEHPFWTGRQWTPAGYLAKGDSLYLASGEFTAVDSIARVDSSAKVYNFHVEDWHNYFVGSAGVLVHNTCPPQHVQSTLKHIDAKNGAPPQGYKGGGKWRNQPEPGDQKLPDFDAHNNPITYKEYDVRLRVKGVNRGKERLVIGSDNSVYYTTDHYHTFTKIR